MTENKEPNRLTGYEMETIINFNKSDGNAVIFTYEKSWQRHFNRQGIKPIADNGFGGLTYTIDKKRILKPRVLNKKKRVFTEEQRKAAADRLMKARSKKTL